MKRLLNQASAQPSGSEIVQIPGTSFSNEKGFEFEIIQGKFESFPQVKDVPGLTPETLQTALIIL